MVSEEVNFEGSLNPCLDGFHIEFKAIVPVEVKCHFRSTIKKSETQYFKKETFEGCHISYVEATHFVEERCTVQVG